MNKEARGRYRASSKLDLSNHFEKGLIDLFILSFIGCVVGTALLFNQGIIQDVIMALPIIGISFAIVGLVAFLFLGRWKFLFGLVVAVGLMLLFGLEAQYSLFVVYVIMGGFGAVSLAVAFQKLYFYAHMSRIEALGFKGQLDWRDRLLIYIFSIQEGTDTRNLTIDYDSSRSSLPIRDVVEILILGLIPGIFIWIYLSLNPALLINYGPTEIIVMMFLTSLYIPLLVLPGIIYKSLNVRISSEFRDFHLFQGVTSTLQKAVPPLMIILIYALFVVNVLSPESVLGYILIFTALNMLVLGATTIIFYAFFEKDLVYSIVSKWKVFRPMPSISERKGSEDRHRSKEFAGTPEREYTESVELEFTPYR